MRAFLVLCPLLLLLTQLCTSSSRPSPTSKRAKTKTKSRKPAPLTSADDLASYFEGPFEHAYLMGFTAPLQRLGSLHAAMAAALQTEDATGITREPDGSHDAPFPPDCNLLACSNHDRCVFPPSGKAASEQSVARRGSNVDAQGALLSAHASQPSKTPPTQTMGPPRQPPGLM